MMEDARRHKFDVLMVWSIDRRARSTKHLLQVLDELNGIGIQFLSQREAIDTEARLGLEPRITRTWLPRHKCLLHLR